MRRSSGFLRHFESFSISLVAHALCLFLLLALPTCRRTVKPEHKIYTFDLIDPSRLTMRKPEPSTRDKKDKPPTREKPEKKIAKKKKVIKKKFTVPKKDKSVEDKIKERLKEIDGKKWLEPSKLDELEKAKLLDTGAFANVWYNDAVASKIYQCWRTPSRAFSEGEDLSVVVRFKILRDGTAVILGVDKKSGSEILDGSALQAIRDAQPLPPLPDDYRGDALEVCMTFIPEE